MYWLSVIVPVYNTGSCLLETLSSIEMQEDKEGVQFVLVDDGSTDGSEEHLKRFRDSYREQTVLIRQQNRGLSAARNMGLMAAEGTYIYFMDGDDCLCPGAFSAFKQISEDENASDLVNFNAITFSHNSGESVEELKESLTGTKTFSDPRDICDFSMRAYVMGGTILRHVVWNKLYRMSIIRKNNIYFRPTSEIGAEDMLFNLEYLSCCKSIRYDDTCIYRYRVERAASIMGRFDGRVMTKRFFMLATAYRIFLVSHFPGILQETYKEHSLYSIYVFALLFLINRQFYRMPAPELVEMFRNGKDNLDIACLRELIRVGGGQKDMKMVMYKDEYRGFRRHRFLILHPYIGKVIAPIYEMIRDRRK